METLPPPIPADAAIARLEAARAGFAAVRPSVEGRGPWALAPDFGTGPEASWGPRELLAHTCEMLAYWYGEYARVIEAGRAAGDGIPFGRDSDDQVRLAIIDRDRQFTLADQFERIDDGIARWARTVAAQSVAGPGAGTAVGRHPRLGEMTADQVRDRMIVTHLEGHIAQMDEILGA
jgi:hypothetical protein